MFVSDLGVVVFVADLVRGVVVFVTDLAVVDMVECLSLTLLYVL